MVPAAAPGMTPAMNSAPTEELVDTEYITMTIDGGIRMPRPPAEAMMPAPKRFGKPRLIIAGIRIEPIATTVAGTNPTPPRTARTPARRHAQAAAQVADHEVAKDHPPRHPAVGQEVAGQMKNGIAMISNFDAENSLSATDSSGTSVKMNRKVKHREAERHRLIGMPISIRTTADRRLHRVA